MSIDFSYAGGVIFTGLVVVFSALIGLSLIVWAMGKLFVSLNGPKKQAPDRPSEKPAPKPAAPAAKPAAPLQVEEGVGDEVVAVIAAAVAAMGGEGGGFVLRSVRRARGARPAWAQAGLLQNTQPF